MSSNIVLSASVRQNLLSLQSTADLLSTTQSRLSTGKKVNTALDNPTNYFTAASLDARASDINNLLDGIGNGVQILQAANTGITSLQKLIDSAKSVASQALQTAVAYTAKSSFTSGTITGATAQNLLGTGAPVDATVDGSLANSKLTVTTAITGSTTLSGGANTDSIGTNFVANDTITVNGQTLKFVASGASGNNEINVTDTVQDLLNKIDTLTGATGSTVNAGIVTLHTGTASNLTISSSNAAAFNSLGFTGGGVTKAVGTGPTPLGGLTLTIPATSYGVPTTITFGTGLNEVATLNQLNAALAPNYLLASIDTTGRITITTSNDSASETIGTITGSATGAGKPFVAATTPSPPVVDPTVQSARANLVTQYNKIIENITTTSQDASFNGVNLLAGDTLKLMFNETGKSVLNIQGVNFTPAGLGLGPLTAGADFIDNNRVNTVITALNGAGSSLRSQAAALGSNLSIVQIRQEFSKNLINVLQTGSANLTLADTNEEAANSQALSTRQSIAVSALALANQSQQSVLQLLR